MDKIWDRKSFKVGGHWPLWLGWKKGMTTQNRQKSNAKDKNIQEHQCIFVSSKKPFSLQYKEFVSLVEKLSDIIKQRHSNYISTSVLHDTDSHNWTETKEFYEVIVQDRV